jgi:hypothetical protein
MGSSGLCHQNFTDEFHERKYSKILRAGKGFLWEIFKKFLHGGGRGGTGKG